MAKTTKKTKKAPAKPAKKIAKKPVKTPARKPAAPAKRAKKPVKAAAKKPVKKAAIKKPAKRPAPKAAPKPVAKAAAKATPLPAPKPAPVPMLKPAPKAQPKHDPGREQLMRLVAALLDKKGQAVTSIEVGDIVGYTEFYLIATGTSSKHNQTLCDAIVESETKTGHHKPRREGYNFGNWIVVDAGDVIVHLFDDASRHHYDLERLFLDSERKLYGEDGKIVDLPRMERRS